MAKSQRRFMPGGEEGAATAAGESVRELGIHALSG